MRRTLLKQMEYSICTNWEKPSLTDYRGATHTYKDVARKVKKIHLLFESCGLQKGDKVALCSRNSSNWAIAWVATISYGAVVVPILNEFKADNVQHIVNHCDAKLFFVGDDVWNGLDEALMPNLVGIFRMADFSLRISRNEALTKARKELNKLFGMRYPSRFEPTDISFEEVDPESLAIINYTSGTTSASKGVMIPMRALTSNVHFAIDTLGDQPGTRLVSILPLAHMYGMMFEFIYGFCKGTHVHFLTRVPSPKIIAEAMSEIRPHLIIAVPLILEKIIRKRVFPTIEKPLVNLMLNVPIINEKIYGTIRQQIIDALGGNFYEIIIGGAPMNKEIEKFLKRINFPFTIGYGMTEFAPILAYSDWKTFVAGSCGKPEKAMQFKIDSADPENEVGEILVRGTNTMLGYYKNPEATAAFFDNEGWAHTGDLGVMDKEGNVFIKGRSKNMILGPSGQNIYPEEIEDRLNNIGYVTESIVIDRNGKLVALVYPDFDALQSQNVAEANYQKTIEELVFQLNKDLPAFSQITAVKLYNEEFEKTPKRSIKRFLYQQ